MNWLTDDGCHQKEMQTMKTAQEIIEYLELAKSEAFELHDQSKGKDEEEAYFHQIVAMTILHLLEEIKE